MTHSKQGFLELKSNGLFVGLDVITILIVDGKYKEEIRIKQKE